MYLGDFIAGVTINFQWNTISLSTGSVTRDTNGTIRIYKNSSITQRSSAAGITDTEDFDSLTGLHHCTIDLSDNTDAGFYAAGNDYTVVIQGMVIGSATINAVLAHFSIENRNDKADVREWIGTAVATPTVAGVPEVDITHLLGTAWLAPGTAGTPDVNVKLWNALTTVALPLAPTVAGRTLDVSVGGEAGIDWANIGSPTTAVNLSATNIDVDQVVASVSGAVGSVTGAVGSVAAGGITAASIATGAVDADALAADAVAEIADGVWDEDATGHQTGGTFGQAIGDPGADTTTIYQSVVTDAAGTNVAADIIAVKAQTAAIETDTAEIGAAGAGLTAINLPNQTMDIVGNITGNLSGSVGSVTGAVGSVAAGGIVAASFGAGAIDAAALAADAGTEIADAILTRQMTESYAANGVAPTLAQAQFAQHQALMQHAISGTAWSVYKLDNVTVAFTITLNDATTPTSARRV